MAKVLLAEDDRTMISLLKTLQLNDRFSHESNDLVIRKLVIETSSSL